MRVPAESQRDVKLRVRWAMAQIDRSSSSSSQQPLTCSSTGAGLLTARN